MGMFDSVWIKCPHCDKRVEEQTKDGECLCSNYDLEDAPPVLKTAVSGYPIECYELMQQKLPLKQAVCFVLGLALL